jgi:hypothetical protein
LAAAALAVGAVAGASNFAPIAPETLTSVAALPAHIAGSFQEVTACQQSAAGTYFIFDRRAHSVYTAPPNLDRAQKLIEIGSEKGRVLDPTAFDLAPDDTFVVADAPGGRGRIQIFTASGSSLGGFFLQTRAVPRVTFRNMVLNGIGNVEYTGRSVLLSQPEQGALVIEYNVDGATVRTFGELRKTGHEDDPDVHLALNSGIVATNPAGGFYFVFLAGVPQFRSYDAGGRLVFERHIEGAEMDAFIQNLPQTWKRQRTDAGVFPLVLPSVYAAAADKAGNLWVTLAAGVTYVYDPAGDKQRVVQFRAAGPLLPTGLSFTSSGRLLAAPGCYAFAANGAAPAKNRADPGRTR